MEERGIIHSANREKKRLRKRYGMKVSGRSTITTILPTLGKVKKRGKTQQEAAEEEA